MIRNDSEYCGVRVALRREAGSVDLPAYLPQCYIGTMKSSSFTGTRLILEGQTRLAFEI